MRETGSDTDQGEGSSSDEDASWSVTVKCDDATKVFTSTRPLTVFAFRALIKDKGVFGITGDVFVFIKNQHGFSLRTDAVVDNGTTVYCTWEPTCRSLRRDAPPWVSEDEDEEAYKPRALNWKKYEDKGYHVKMLYETQVDDTVHIHITLQRPPPQDSISSDIYSSLPTPPYPSPPVCGLLSAAASSLPSTVCFTKMDPMPPIINMKAVPPRPTETPPPTEDLRTPLNHQYAAVRAKGMPMNKEAYTMTPSCPPWGIQHERSRGASP